MHHHPSDVNIDPYPNWQPSSPEVVIEFLVYSPPTQWLMGSQRTAIIVHDRSRTQAGVHAFKDSGSGIANVYHGNSIHPTVTTITGLGTIHYRISLPTTQTVDTIVHVLEGVPKVDLDVNPGAMFPWTFGNYVKRALQNLVRRGHVDVTPFNCSTADDFYDRYLAFHFGKGH